MLPPISAAVLGILCVTAGFLDVRDRRLPNWLCVLTAALGLIAIAILLSPYSALLAAAHGLAALIIGMVLFQFGVFGGGDAKFYAGIACWFPLSQGMLLLALTSFFALLFVAFWFAVSYKKRDSETQASAKKTMLPFGVPIAAAGFSGFCMSPIITF
ncbi:prepilin peptidase [Altererythrobacter sp. ZODW24]|uniref:A24 family peptidase n=1 Tax=Altererythrobacter sp. ZODW24 TaxID=2185142 RepID=UPI000DF73169|nr:prepilin peptidase [Altererythrobacter sp. ZODW24]